MTPRRPSGLLRSAGMGVVAAAAVAGLAAPANAQVTRNFVGVKNTQWTLGSNWSPFGVPTPLDRVRFAQGGGFERWVHLPESADLSVKMLTVAPLLTATTEYRLDLGEGVLRLTSTNGPSLIVGQGGASTLATLAVQHGDLFGGQVYLSVLGPGHMRVESGEAGFARLFADEVIVGGFYPGELAIDGRVETNSGRLTGDVVLARGSIVIGSGGDLEVDGGLYVGIDRTKRPAPASFEMGEFSFATVGSMKTGPLATVSTRRLILDPELRGRTPALGVVGDFDLSGGARFGISDALIQRPGATLKISNFAGASPFLPIDGDAQLAGTFVLTFAPSFDPPLDSAFPLLSTQTGVLGRWTVSYLPGMTGGRFLTIDYPDPGAQAGQVVLGVDQLDQILDYDDPEDGISIPPGPKAAVIGDFNNDGKPDVAIAFADPDHPESAPGSVAILINRGVGPDGWLGFQSQITLTVLADPRAIDVADFDLDGRLDLVVAGYTPHAAQVLMNLGAGWDIRTPIALTSGPVDIKTADFTGDGRPDAVCALPDIESVVQLTNQLRTFDLVPELPRGVGLVVDAVDPFDPDNDKDGDVGGAGQASGRGVSGQAFVQLNNGEGGFGDTQRTNVGEGPVDIASGDFDGDGFPELVTVDSASNTVSVLVNDGFGGFSQAFALPVGGDPRSITIADLDGDGDNDIAIVADSVGERVVQVLRNDTQSIGDLVFAPVSDLFAGPDPSLVLSADLNGDDRIDLLAINPSGPRGDGGQVTVLLSKSKPRCPADFDRNGVVNEFDLVAFLAAWFRDLENGSFVTDFNQDNVVNSTDVSDYVTAYLKTPPECLGG